jgi:hypothetical protein
LTELRIEEGHAGRRDRPRLAGRARRPALLLGVTLLCGLAYLLGIWTGTKSKITCVTTAPGHIVCSSDGAPQAPLRPPALPEQSPGSA